MQRFLKLPDTKNIKICCGGMTNDTSGVTPQILYDLRLIYIYICVCVCCRKNKGVERQSVSRERNGAVGEVVHHVEV